MAIPSREIGQPSSTKAQLLWNISKQLEVLTKVMYTAFNPPAPSTTTTTTTAASTYPTVLTIVNNSSINHGAYTSTFYVIYNSVPTTVVSGSSLDAGQTMSFSGNSTLDSNNVLQLYSNNGLLPFYVDTVTNTVTSNPITYTDITGNGFNSPYVNGITVDVTIVANGITITLIDTPL
jgi:hypothetical protein